MDWARLTAWIGGGTEEETPRKGLLSARSEWHALILGALIGLTVSLTGRVELLALVVPAILGLKRINSKSIYEMKREPWYTAAGILLMWVIT